MREELAYSKAEAVEVARPGDACLFLYSHKGYRMLVSWNKEIGKHGVEEANGMGVFLANSPVGSHTFFFLLIRKPVGSGNSFE